MKRPLVIILSVIVVLAILVVGSTWVLGSLTEQGVRNYIAEIETSPATRQVDLELPEYERGFLKSSGSTSIGVQGVKQQAFLKHEIFHGPFAMTPDGFKAGYAYIVTTLDRDKFPAELKESLAEVYGENEPFSVKTTVPLAGSRVSEVEIAAVDHDAGNLALKFDGGECRFEVASDNKSMSGSIQFGALSMKETSDGVMTLKLDPTDLRISGEEESSFVANGSIGKCDFNKSDESGPGISIAMEAIGLDANYEAMEEGSNVLLGTAKVITPKVAVKIADSGGIEVTDLSIQSGTSEKGDLIESTAAYEVTSVNETFSQGGASAPYLEVLKTGAKLTAVFRVPKSAMEALAEIQKEMQASQRELLANPDAAEEIGAEQAKVVADTYEHMLRALTKGTGFSLGIASGEEDAGVNLDIALTYTGDKPLTAQKTILDLVQSMLVKLGARLPKALLPESEGMQQQMAMLTMTGSVAETPTAYLTEMVLENGKLTTNGQPNLLFEQMAPMMMQEIPWDAMFDGMRQAGAKGDEGE